MLDYHADFVIKIDLILLALLSAFAAMLIIYVVLRDHICGIRTRRLFKIKENLERQLLSGENIKISAKSAARTTPGDFLDVMTNRRKYTISFNKSEQQLFKKSFITPDKIKALESRVKSPRNKWRRIEAIAALGYTRSDSALIILKKTLYSKDEDVSYFSALAIGQIGAIRSVGVLMNFLKNRPPMRRKTASILEALDRDITGEVIKFADDADSEVRVWAVRLLAKSRSESYIKKVEALTNDVSPDVRAAACESLGKLNYKDSKKALVRCLKDEIWFVRMHAVRSLSKIFGREAMPEIISLLNDGSLFVLESVKTAMAANIGAALPYMKNIFKGTDELAKKLCREAMKIAGYQGPY